MKTQKKILLSTAYLPPVEYFACLAMEGVEVFIEKFETYPKQTYRNRCEIYAEKGKMSLSIPVKRINGNHTMTKDVVISHVEKWSLIHWRTLEAAYTSSPYFLFYRDDIEPFFNKQYDNLFDFNLALINIICDAIGISPKIESTTDYQKTPDGFTDLRNVISPKINSSKCEFPEYIQVFGDRHGFLPNLSIVDALFNLGPETLNYLNSIK